VADITPQLPSGRQVIQGYGEGGFRIAGQRHAGSVLVFPERTLPWPVTAVSSITLQSLQPVLAPDAGIRVLLIGCGARMTTLDPALRQELRAAGIGVETMDTGAACRTFNVLLAEARAAAAALIAVG
jgi:uncharacterized protein